MSGGEEHIDQDLMRRIGAGDEAALEQLYERHQGGISRFLFRMCRDGHLVDEVLQETFVSAWKAAGRWRPDAKVRTWLFTIARNAFLNARRKRRDLPAVEAEASHDPVASAEQADEVARVRRAMETLDSDDRTALQLILEEGLKYEEAAEVLGWAVGTVKSRVHRALAKLKSKLGYESGPPPVS